MPTPCFLVRLQPRRYRVRLRRYCPASGGATACRAGGLSYHNAEVPLGIEERDTQPTVVSKGPFDHDEAEADDRPWPTHCDACGAELKPSETTSQVWYDPLYRADDGREWPIRELPPGAMFHADWREEIDHMQDGACPAVILPDGETWFIGSEPMNGGQWTWSGTMPRLTVGPSIRTPGYHGFLRDGVLTDDIDRRPAR